MIIIICTTYICIWYSSLLPFSCSALHKLNGHHHAHVQHDQVRHKEADGAGRLRHHIDRIDDGVEQAHGENNPEQIDRNGRLRIGERVQEHDQHDRNDVLQIVEMGAPDALHLLGDLHFGAIEAGVLWIGEGLDGGGGGGHQYPWILDE